MVYYRVVLICAMAASVSAQVTVPNQPFKLDFGNFFKGFGGAAGRMPGLFNGVGKNAGKLHLPGIPLLGSDTKNVLSRLGAPPGEKEVPKLVNQGVQGTSGTGQQNVSTENGGSADLSGCADVIKQGVDIIAHMAGMIPGLDGLAYLGGGLAKAGVDVANVVGQAGKGLSPEEVKTGSGAPIGLFGAIGNAMDKAVFTWIRTPPEKRPPFPFPTFGNLHMKK